MPFALLLVVLAPALALPDLILPGNKRVDHELILVGDTTVDGASLVAYPTRGFDGPVRIEEGVAFPFSAKYGTRIYAVPDGAELPEKRKEWTDAPWPVGDIPVAHIGSVRRGNPLDRVETHLRLVKVDGRDVILKVVEQRSFDEAGNEIGGHAWFVLVLIAAAGLVLLALMARRRTWGIAEEKA